MALGFSLLGSLPAIGKHVHARLPNAQPLSDVIIMQWLGHTLGADSRQMKGMAASLMPKDCVPRAFFRRNAGVPLVQADPQA